MIYSPSRSVKLLWTDRNGKTDSTYSSVLSTNEQMAAIALYDGTASALWYNVGPSSTNYTIVDAATGISKFWFEVAEGDGSTTKVEDQGGAGFAVQDVVMIANSSCVVQPTSNAHIQIAVSPSLPFVGEWH